MIEPMTQDPTLRAIIKQIRELDIQAKRLHTKRVELVHSLETAIDVYDVVDRGESTDRILFRRGERVEINNQVTSKSGSLFDRRATVLDKRKLITDRSRFFSEPTVDNLLTV